MAEQITLPSGPNLGVNWVGLGYPQPTLLKFAPPNTHLNTFFDSQLYTTLITSHVKLKACRLNKAHCLVSFSPCELTKQPPLYNGQELTVLKRCIINLIIIVS